MKFALILSCVVLAVNSAAPNADQVKKILDHSMSKFKEAIDNEITISGGDISEPNLKSLSLKGLKNCKSPSTSKYVEASKQFTSSIVWGEVNFDIDYAEGTNTIKGSCKVPDVTIDLDATISVQDENVKWDDAATNGKITINQPTCNDDTDKDLTTKVKELITKINADTSLTSSIGKSLAPILNKARDIDNGAFMASPLSVLLLLIALFATIF